MNEGGSARLRISLIVPCYNSCATIERCIGSILSQTYSDVELILVDDGSSDSTVDIINNYIRKDSRVRLIEQKHGGPNMARGAGVRKASGEYIMFVDSDDYLSLDAVEILCRKIEEYKVESIRFNGVNTHNQRIVQPILSKGIDEKILNKKEIDELLLTTYRLNCLWSQVYKTDALKKVKAFNSNIVFGEDFLVNLEVHRDTSKMLVLNNKPLYYYCDNHDSTTRNNNRERILNNVRDRLFVSNQAIHYAQEYIKDEYLKNKIIYSQIKMLKNTILNVRRIDGYTKQQFINDLGKLSLGTAFSSIKKDELKKYINSVRFIDRLKHSRAVLALVYPDYDYIWKYIIVYRFYDNLCSRVNTLKKKRVFLEMYLKKNLGDDLFLQIIANRYPQIVFNVNSKNDNIANLNLANVRGLNLFKRILNRLKNKLFKTKLDASKKHSAKIILGGSMFIEQQKTKEQLINELNNRYLNKNIPLFILGSNFGPYKNDFYFNEYKKVFRKAEDVCFREEYSKQLFKDLDNVRVAPDIVFGLNTEKYNSVKQKKKVVISVIDLENRKELRNKLNEYENVILKIANYYAEKKYEVILMSFCKGEGDENAINRILEKTNNDKIKSYYYNGNIDEALVEIASSEIVVGTRFHSIILGLVFNKKILPIIYSNKTKNMLNDLKFKGKMLEINDINKINNKNIDSYVSDKLNIDKQRKLSEKHFEKLDEFIRENM